jgi:hypothetical protein
MAWVPGKVPGRAGCRLMTRMGKRSKNADESRRIQPAKTIQSGEYDLTSSSQIRIIGAPVAAQLPVRPPWKGTSRYTLSGGALSMQLPRAGR